MSYFTFSITFFLFSANVLFFLNKVNCQEEFVTETNYTVLVYEYPPTVNPPTGFSTLSYDQNSQPLWTSFGTYLGTDFNIYGIVPCDEGYDCLIAWGSVLFQYDKVIGNILLYNLTTGAWKEIGTGIGGPYLACAAVRRDEVYVSGPNIFLYQNPVGVNLAGIAKCNYITGECTNVGSPINEVTNCASMFFVSSETHLIVTHHDGFQSGIELFDGENWRTLFLGSLGVVSVFKYMDRLAIYMPYGNFSSSSVTFCERASYALLWDHSKSCWDDISNLTPFIESRSIGFNHLFSNDGVNLFGVIFVNTCWKELQLFDSTEWVTLPVKFDTQFCKPLNAFSSNNVLALQYSFNYTDIVYLDSMKQLPFNFECQNNAKKFSTPVGTVSVIENQLWESCSSGMTLTLIHYDLDTKFSEVSESINHLFDVAQDSEIYSMCSFGKNLFLAGDFVCAGTGLETPNGVALWNGTSYRLPPLPNLLSSQALSCGSNHSHVAIYYVDTDYGLQLVLLNNLDEVVGAYSIDTGFNYTTNTLLGVALAEERYVILLDTGIYAFDLYEKKLTPIVVELPETSVEYSISVQGTILYIGGNFTLSIPTPNNPALVYKNIAKYDLSEKRWKEIESILGAELTAVYSISHDDQNVYAFGIFDEAGSLEVNNVAGGNITGEWIDSCFFGISGTFWTRAVFNPSDQFIYAIGIKYGFNDGQLASYNKVTGWNSNLNKPNAGHIHLLQTVKEIVKPEKLKWWYILVAALSGVAVVTALMILFYVGYSRYKKRIKYIAIPDFKEAAINQRPYEIIKTDPEITKIREDEIIFKQVVGYGGQAEVWKVFYNGKLVAAKSIYFTNDTSDVTKFMQEVKLLSSLQHKHIIQFFGVVITTNSKMWLITELMDIKLTDVIDVLTDKNKRDIALAVAKAMKYLHHEVKPPVLHRDLKPDNVLVNREGVCKLADFGLSRLQTIDNKTKVVGTIDYMAPEIFTGQYSEKADVYSYGIMLCELFGGKPYDFSQYQYVWEVVQIMHSNKLKPKLPQQCPDDIASIVLECIRKNPDERPSFIDLVQKLKKLALL